jgi:hypothetical protein
MSAAGRQAAECIGGHRHFAANLVEREADCILTSSRSGEEMGT